MGGGLNSEEAKMCWERTKEQVQNKNKQKNNTSQSDTPAGRRIFGAWSQNGECFYGAPHGMAIFWLSTFLINSDHVYQSILSRFCLGVTPFNEMHRCDDHPIKTMGISELRSWQSQGLQPPSLELPSWHAPPACQARGCEGADAGWAVENGLPIHIYIYIYKNIWWKEV